LRFDTFYLFNIINNTLCDISLIKIKEIEEFEYNIKITLIKIDKE
jgi:hypothetical protein